MMKQFNRAFSEVSKEKIPLNMQITENEIDGWRSEYKKEKKNFITFLQVC